MTIQIRQAVAADQAAILAISAQIWGGSDYVPSVIEKWLKPELGILWVAESEGVVAGFSRMTFLSGNRCWLEGIRVDPAQRGKGIGKALTQFQMTEGERLGFSACALSSYCENYESLQIVRSHGFEETAQFKFFDWTRPSPNDQDEQWQEAQVEAEARRKALLEGVEVRQLQMSDWPELINELTQGHVVQARNGYFSYDWTFERVEPSFLKERLAAGDFYELTQGGASTILSLSSCHAKGRYHTLNYVSNLDLEGLALAFAMEQMTLRAETALSYMALNSDKKDLFESLGFYVFNDAEKDVFVFERNKQEA